MGVERLGRAVVPFWLRRYIPHDPEEWARDALLQWRWLLPGVKPEDLGVHWGPYTWLRRHRHARMHRPVAICLLERRTPIRFGQLMAMWINERTRLCRARVNQEADRADIVWVFTQDPLDARARHAVSRQLRRVRTDAVIVNPPAVYNAYHDPQCFTRLDAAGVSVPRSRFSSRDHGTPVVYKTAGTQTAPKTLEPYDGPRTGMRAFEFIDGRGPDGRYRCYRAFYVLGVVRPSSCLVSRHWNVHRDGAEAIEYTFAMTDVEQEQVRLIARTLGLGYFAVDYLRRAEDGTPVFVDINVYPNLDMPPSVKRRLGGTGRWHTFDIRPRLGLPEPTGGAMGDLFDNAVLALLEGARGRRRPDQPAQ